MAVKEINVTLQFPKYLTALSFSQIAPINIFNETLVFVEFDLANANQGHLLHKLIIFIKSLDTLSGSICKHQEEIVHPVSIITAITIVVHFIAFLFYFRPLVEKK